MSQSNGSKKKAVYLAMPGYGGASMGAARGFFRAARPDGLQVRLNYFESSLLPTNFNCHWAAALNARLAGNPVDFFAMLHSDVQPQDFWLDKLVAELERRNLDVLSAVVPIKDSRGLTSTGLGDPGNAWRPQFRLSMKEVYRLPETFTAADLGQPGAPLLVNTGCWVCRFDPQWAEQVHFEVNNRIVFDAEKKRFREETEPEDWNFSRQCHRLGLKVAATRIVALSHRGPAEFVNDKPWGEWTHDAEYLGVPTVFPDRGEWLFPHDAEGWLSEDEGRELARLAQGKEVLEIGSYCGRSTICLAKTARSVDCIDTFDGRATPSAKPTFDSFDANLRRYGVRENVRAHKGTTCDVSARWNGPRFDMVFIDAAHDLTSVRQDAEEAMRLLRPGGLLAFHDYRRHPGEYDGRWDQGVTEAVNELLAGGAELLGRVGTLAVVRPPALTPVEECIHG